MRRVLSVILCLGLAGCLGQKQAAQAWPVADKAMQKGGNAVEHAARTAHAFARSLDWLTILSVGSSVAAIVSACCHVAK
jgi:hypothetical protein